MTLRPEPTELVLDEAFWEERYRSHEAVWSGRPNPQLVAEAGGLTPGTALDVGSGEGADALWLAQRGWQVTAVDFSTTALARAARHAGTLGPDVAERVTWTHRDLMAWVPPATAFDLVTAQYLHTLPGPRRSILAGLADAVAPGGILLVVGHHPLDLQTPVPRPPRPELFPTAEDLAAALDPHRWEVLVVEARPRPATAPDGRAATVHDAVLTARRRP